MLQEHLKLTSATNIKARCLAEFAQNSIVHN